MKTNEKLITIFIFLHFVVFYFLLCLLNTSSDLKSPFVKEYETILPVRAKIKEKTLLKGLASYYSEDGCLGCSEDMITASGDKFDEDKFTLAIPLERKDIAMNTRVIVTNLDNGRSVEAVINDRGGFGKYNRVADLSKALYEELEVKTDVSIIEIKEI